MGYSDFAPAAGHRLTVGSLVRGMEVRVGFAG